jgi:hypothetical protein
MPGFDGTGPQGLGPMTGGGRGYCVVPLSGNRSMYLGRRFSGRGGARGRRNWYYATGFTGWQRASLGYPAFGKGFYPVDALPLSVKEEMDTLKEQAKFLEERLQDIKQRISTLESQVPKEE